jgi:hypothetical protein
MSKYLISGTIISPSDSNFNEVVGNAYDNKISPLCICRSPGVKMYIAKVSGQHIIKRMPNTGSNHASICDSYEPPPELSGLGQVMGSAIQENPLDGVVDLKFDFSLSRITGRVAPTPGSSEADSVKTDGNKLSLRGTLHYLWEEANFNRWSPAMLDKRNWFVIRKYLLQAAEDKRAKGLKLADILYIPENFSEAQKSQIEQRRIAHFMKTTGVVKAGGRRLMLCVGELKEISKSRFGHKIVFRHAADCPFMLNDDIYDRLLKRFELEVGLCDAIPDSHLMAICTFAVDHSGVPSVEEIALMAATEQWIPFESAYDKIVIDAMIQANRRFTKGLRYNLASTKPLACLVASDTHPEPTAMYVIPPGNSEAYDTALSELISESKLHHWKWDTASENMPPLPPTAPESL